jgi:alginate O-acetyltransferase complex protein AlgI
MVSGAMIFLAYEFIFFALAFFALYYLIRSPRLRLVLVIVGGVFFQFYYGGWISVAPIGVLAAITFLAGRSGNPQVMLGSVILCVAVLAVFKYASFLSLGVVGAIAPDLGTALQSVVKSYLPATIPLGVSFFTFEFVHYLADVRRGSPPIRRLRDFLAFALFWPTMVAGPIKRYQQFVPALHQGVAQPTSADAMVGLVRIATGFAKKWAADNLTGWIESFEPHYATQTIGMRWLFLLALSLRILLDFSGYSDMAIGFARMMGIVVPENFNWPYLARSPMEFWQRWHMSLSSWIRDYIYIPLGGNRLGLPRRVFNAIVAMALCGLWHGPDWNFVVWGLYHGVGLTAGAMLQGRLTAWTDASVALRAAIDAASWAATTLFVCLGWLLFFYPVGKAAAMAWQLFVP